MKTIKLWMLAALLTCGSMEITAQTNLAGREYYNSNIMKDMIDKAMDEADADFQKKLDEALVNAEKDKGRKLTAEEKAEIDKKVKEAQELLAAMKKGMSTGITITFKDETNMVMKTDMKMDDEVLKKAGISWAKRKLMKAAVAVMPAQKGTYTVEKDMVIMNDGKDLDTMRISSDGKYLYGKMDEKTPFTLTRTK